MSDWKAGFKRALIDAIVREGSLVSKKPSFYGWADYALVDTARDYLAVHGIDYDRTSQPQESDWQEFMGTFHEGDTTVYGADVHIVAMDGQTFHWRYSGNVSDLIQAVIRED